MVVPLEVFRIRVGGIRGRLVVYRLNHCSMEALLLHIRTPRLVDVLYSSRAKYQGHSRALPSAPSMNISHGNSPLPVVIVLTGVSQRNGKGSLLFD